uniref:Calvin cycle protein CP12 n=1 Tax=Anthurium amnicola TaxID=1678845 RepID=A0A1D1Z0E2_9ARAE
MASSACSPRVGALHRPLLPSPLRRPAALAAQPCPRRSVVPIGWAWGGGGAAGRERGVRVMAVVRKYKGTRMREKRLAEMIEQKVMEAKEACEGDARSEECKVAWDEVEEVSQAKADLRRRLAAGGPDPLESFCQENPETDECRVYED